MKIHSAAQLAMFRQAAADHDYAASRGITSELAQQHLDAHKEAGEPHLPERIAPSRATSARPKTNPSRPVYLTSQRAG